MTWPEDFRGFGSNVRPRRVVRQASGYGHSDIEKGDAVEPVEPYFVRFHWSDGFAPFLVTHEAGSDEDDTELRSGWVIAADTDNDAGLTDGMNRRDRIGHGGPGIPGSWSSYNE